MPRAPDPDEQDPHLKMTNNLLAIIMALVLLLCGFWLAWQMAEDRRTQDCLTSGFRNCSARQKLVP
jgi:hypothetical protein